MYRVVQCDWKSATSSIGRIPAARRHPPATKHDAAHPPGRPPSATTSASKDRVQTSDVALPTPYPRSTAMSSRDSLYTVVHTLFHEAFGQPHAMEGGGQQWKLRP